MATTGWTPVDESAGDEKQWKPVDEQQPPAAAPAPKAAAAPPKPPTESTTTRFARGAGLPTNWREAATGAAEMAVPGLGSLANTVGTLRSLPDTARYWSDMAAHPSKLGPTLSTIKPELAGLGTSTAAMMATPAEKPIARGTGALMEGTGKLARTPMPDMHMPFVGGPVTPARVIGGVGGGLLGHEIVSGHPYGGLTAGASAGALAGDLAARGVERGGAALRRYGGYEPPAPPAYVRYPDFKPPTPPAANRYLGVEPPVSEGAAPARFTQQPRLTQGGKPFRAGGQPLPKPEPFKTTDVSRPFPASRFTPIEPAPSAGRTPAAFSKRPPLSNSIIPAEPEGGGIVRPGAAAGNRQGFVIKPGERIDPLRAQSAGSAAQATEFDLQRLAKHGDQSAVMELNRRRLLREGQPRDYANIPRGTR
jgi:hypothetical protein